VVLAHTDKHEVRNACNRTNYLERRKPLMSWWRDDTNQPTTGNMSLAAKKELKIPNHN